jgi:hypothetical protein
LCVVLRMTILDQDSSSESLLCIEEDYEEPSDRQKVGKLYSDCKTNANKRRNLRSDEDD